MAASFNEWEIQMTTYNTYQEAKIANPESNIYIQAGEFLPEKGIRPSPWTYDFRGLALCNPADYCMTVEEFLADGHKFVEGDVFINSPGKVKAVTNNEKWISTLNLRGFGDDERYILRAAALEEKVKMDNSIKYVARKQFNKILNVDPINQNLHAQVEYVKCNFSREWEAVKYYNEEGELFVIDCNGNYSNVNDISGAWYEVVCKNYQSIYRPVTEREAFIEALQSVWIIDGVDGQEQLEKIVDSGLFKLVN